MAKKLIGLTGPSAFTQQCIDMIEEFYEADFVMLYHNDENSLDGWVERCDGVILAGGVDIHPSVYNDSIWNNQGFGKFDLHRDVREMRIIDRCNFLNKPYFGICRGHQLIGASLGFFLVPDLSGSSVCHQPHKQGINLEAWEPMHTVRIIHPDETTKVFKFSSSERNSINRMMGYKPLESLFVNSFHHQGLAYHPKRNMDGVRVYGTSRIDLHGVKEIVELMGGDNWFSCQWHPEFDYKYNSTSRAMLERFKVLLEKQ